VAGCFAHDVQCAAPAALAPIDELTGEAGIGAGEPERVPRNSAGPNRVLHPRGEALTERVGLQNAVDLHLGSRLAMPFPDVCFDVVWTQNACMNIHDKKQLIGEQRRVLRPGGRSSNGFKLSTIAPEVCTCD